MTYAIKAQKKLKSKNIYAQIIKINEDDESNGCTYGLSVAYTDYYTAVDELNNAEISYKTLFHKKAN